VSRLATGCARSRRARQGYGPPIALLLLGAAEPLSAYMVLTGRLPNSEVVAAITPAVRGANRTFPGR
jgi:hypothetical protein